ncbi:MAG: lytic murein transglycosylase, partial [Candidatus Pacebacteria bacterium]|nr:lytic murein transglycosylase [Candidatus Paceibacterota bacterium]
ETSGVKNEVKRLDTKIRISQAYINQKIAKANSLKKDMKTNSSDISSLEEDLKNINKSLSTLLYEKNLLETNTALEAILMSNSLSDFYNDTQLLKIISSRISDKIDVIKSEKISLERLSIELSEREMLERQLARERDSEKKNIVRNKGYKNELLTILQKEEGDLEKSILGKEEARQAILKKKYTLASGDAVTFGEAYNAINPYKGVLGMDPAFVLAILFQESGNGGKIGGNIGQCTYDQKNTHGNSKNGYTVMSNSQKTAFLDIMKGLGRDPSVQKISCPIPKDGSYGGAMGPAQFMPNTWFSIRSKTGKILGKSDEELSPFINGDAFIASAVYLKDQYYSKSCSAYAEKYKHISSVRTLRERCAASRYYAGGAWWKYRMTYGQSVVRRADKFRADIRILEDD